MTKLLLIAAILLSPFTLFAKKKVTYRKSQDVSFSGAEVDGQSRSPDGAYLQHRKAMKFLPMYKVRDNFKEKIKDSIEYLR